MHESREMDHKSNCTKPDTALSSSVLSSGESSCLDSSISNQKVMIHELDEKKTGHDSQINLVKNLSKEELKIRLELEEDIERSLEDEIKEGIYSLAMRLHRLYQHKTKREKHNNVEKATSEVNIFIKVDGETKIEIRETKKKPSVEKGSSIRSSRLENSQGLESKTKKKFEWEKSLRSSDSGKDGNERVKNKELEWKW